MSFEVKEFGITDKQERRVFAAKEEFRPIVVLTSNSEKNLPDAFLRRCVFYHITFPDKDRLRNIVRNRLPLSRNFTDTMLDNAIDHFENIRKQELRKKPATAEALAWIRILNEKVLDVGNLKQGEEEILALSYSVLAKNKEDKERLENSIVNKFSTK